MKDNAKKNILFLAVAGFVLVMVNAAVLMGIRNGQIAPVDNLGLWGAFAVLNVCSLLWAVSLLGLQPLVVAVSYAAGGFLAFRGARLMPGVNVAEIATAGATYGAFGALVVGNATTKVRMAFFTKRQIPFVFIIVALLLVDGLLNSRVSNAGWNVIVNALVFPFLLSGVVVGLVWVVFVRIRAGQVFTKKEPETAGLEMAEAIVDATTDDEETAQLMFSVPESADVAEPMEAVALAPDPASAEEEPSVAPVAEMESPEADLPENDSSCDYFFPLEIDKDEDTVPQENDPKLMDVAAMVAESAPEPDVEADPVAKRDEPLLGQSHDHVDTRNGTCVAPPSSKDAVFLSEESPPDPDLADEQPRETDHEREKADSNDWLSSHLDLLNKLN